MIYDLVNVNVEFIVTRTERQGNIDPDFCNLAADESQKFNIK